MIHFFQELNTLYHRSLVISLNSQSQDAFFNEWISLLWDMSPDQKSFYTLPYKKDKTATVNRWASGSLGMRNKSEQSFLSTSLSLSELKAKPNLTDLGDSLFIEVDWSHPETKNLFNWVPTASLSSKKLVWCLKTQLSAQPSLHELALDKKMKEIAPDSLRILWKDAQFMRDALVWALNF
jgi:hypothetical protein